MLIASLRNDYDLCAIQISAKKADIKHNLNKPAGGGAAKAGQGFMIENQIRFRYGGVLENADRKVSERVVKQIFF